MGRVVFDRSFAASAGGFVEKIVKQGGLLFAIAILAFGIEHIGCVRFRACE
jgi:hypothetical protein